MLQPSSAKFQGYGLFSDSFTGGLVLQRLLVFKTWPPAGEAIERCLGQHGGISGWTTELANSWADHYG